MPSSDSLLDFGNYPEIDSAGIGDFHILGNRLRFVMFDWYKIGGVWQRRIVGMAKMPLTAIPAASVQHWSSLFTSARPIDTQHLLAMH